jgi:hypothetical protein
MIEIEGLGFFAEDELTDGDFESEAADWIQSAKVDMSEADAVRMIVTSMKILSKKMLTGPCTIDILGRVFELMQEMAAEL